MTTPALRIVISIVNRVVLLYLQFLILRNVAALKKEMGLLSQENGFLKEEVRGLIRDLLFVTFRFTFLAPSRKEKALSGRAHGSSVSGCSPGETILKKSGGVVNSSICCPDDLGHRDVTTSEARDFAEFSKMALANLLDTRSTNLQTFLC